MKILPVVQWSALWTLKILNVKLNTTKDLLNQAVNKKKSQDIH